MPLPPRPYTVDPSYVTRQHRRIALAAILGLATLVVCTVFQLQSLRELRSDLAVWRDGELASDVHVGGKVSSHAGLFNRYDLAVEYTDGGGVVHHGRLAFSLLVASIPQGAPVTLKLDPRAPDRFALSWELEYASARYLTLACVFLLIAGLMGGGLLLASWRRLDELRLLRSVAERSDEIELLFVGLKPVIVRGKQTATTVQFRRAPKERRQSRILMDAEEPLFADAARTRLVALVSPARPGDYYLVRADLRPFVIAR